jgi:hypothetical protein
MVHLNGKTFIFVIFLLQYVYISTSSSNLDGQYETKFQSKINSKRFLIFSESKTEYNEKKRKEKEYTRAMRQLEEKITTLYLRIYIKSAMKLVANNNNNNNNSSKHSIS